MFHFFPLYAYLHKSKMAATGMVIFMIQGHLGVKTRWLLSAILNFYVLT